MEARTRPTGARAAPAALAGAVLAVSFSGILIREADSGAAVVVWTRLTLTLPFLLPLLAADLCAGRRPRSRADWVAVTASGLFLAVHFLTWTASLHYTSVASSVLLVCTHPALVALAGRRLLGEPMTARLGAGIALSLVGVAVTAGGDLRLSGTALVGDLLALAGMVAMTGYILIGRRGAARWGAAAYSVPCYAIAAAAALAMAPAGGDVLPTPRTALACLGLALVCTVLGHTVINWTLGHLRATTISLALLGEPPLTALLALPFLGEAPPGSTLGGGALVLVGLALALGERPPELARAEIVLPSAER